MANTSLLFHCSKIWLHLYATSTTSYSLYLQYRKNTSIASTLAAYTNSWVSQLHCDLKTLLCAAWPLRDFTHLCKLFDSESSSGRIRIFFSKYAPWEMHGVMYELRNVWILSRLLTSRPLSSSNYCTRKWARRCRSVIGNFFSGMLFLARAKGRALVVMRLRKWV